MLNLVCSVVETSFWPFLLKILKVRKGMRHGISISSAFSPVTGEKGEEIEEIEFLS